MMIQGLNILIKNKPKSLNIFQGHFKFDVRLTFKFANIIWFTNDREYEFSCK